jgi:hypothetical protein
VLQPARASVGSRPPGRAALGIQPPGVGADNPLSPGYASRYGLPAENVANANFIEAATLRPGTPFVTRPAPGIGDNVGGGIEVVVPSGGVQMQWFTGTP